MPTHLNKTPDTNKATSENQNSNEAAFQFVDQRPEAIAQRKLQAIMNGNNQQTQRAAQLQTIMNGGSQMQRATQLQTLADNRINHSIQRKEVLQQEVSPSKTEAAPLKKTGTAIREPIQRVTVARYRGQYAVAYSQVSTLADLNILLNAHGMGPITVTQIYHRLRPGGRKAVGSQMFARNDGTTLDEYVQLRLGNLADGGLDGFVDTAVANVGDTFFDNRTASNYDSPGEGKIMANSLSLDGPQRVNKLNAELIVGLIRRELETIIENRQPQNVVGTNGFTVTGAAANSFIDDYDATLTQIVTALTTDAVARNGQWNRVRLVNNNNYKAELKIGGIPDYRVFSPRGSNVMSIIGDSLH